MITFDQLAHSIQPHAFFRSGADLHRTANKLTQVGIDYRSRVLQPVASGAIWSDSAQPKVSRCSPR